MDNEKENKNTPQQDGIPLAELLAQRKKESVPVELENSQPINKEAPADEAPQMPSLNSLKATKQDTAPLSTPTPSALEQPKKKSAQEALMDKVVGETSVVGPKEPTPPKLEKVAPPNTNTEPATPAPTPAPTPTETEEPDKKVANTILSSVRTYKSDVAQAMKQQNTSVVSAVAAEAKRRAQYTAPFVEKKKPNYGLYIIIAISTLLFLGGGATLYWVFTQQNTPAQEEQKVSSFIFVEEQSGIDVTNKSRTETLQQLTQTKNAVSDTLGSIRQLIPYTADPIAGTQHILSTAEFFSLIDARAPSSFVRSLNQDFTLGVHVFNGNQPLLVFKTDSFENAFAGMLSWERDIQADLAPLFGPTLDDITLSTSTATSTALRFIFKDEVVRNQDARVLRDKDGAIVLLYAFPSKDTLIITTSSGSFAETIVRLAR